MASSAAPDIQEAGKCESRVPEDNPESIAIIQRKAEAGMDVRILMADPDSQECIKRGVEERLFDAIPAGVRMALAYYAPLAGVPGVEFRLQAETLYNSIFVYDDEMLVNQHVYGMYGYMAPILHLRRMDGGGFLRHVRQELRTRLGRIVSDRGIGLLEAAGGGN
jgi:hypothetical protein